MYRFSILTYNCYLMTHFLCYNIVQLSESLLWLLAEKFDKVQFSLCNVSLNNFNKFTRGWRYSAFSAEQAQPRIFLHRIFYRQISVSWKVLLGKDAFKFTDDFPLNYNYCHQWHTSITQFDSNMQIIVARRCKYFSYFNSPYIWSGCM